MNHQKYNNEFKTHAVEMVLKEGLTRTVLAEDLKLLQKISAVGYENIKTMKKD